MAQGHYAPGDGPVALSVTPETAGWTYLSFMVLNNPGSSPDGAHRVNYPDREVAVVPIEGTVIVEVDGAETVLTRDSVFTQMPQVLYVPPGHDIAVSGSGQCALGSAPAVGKYPIRLIEPSEMRNEIRGGGAARRQVVHVLGPDLPAERLVLFEVYVPRGTWSGWPPHCHDGRDGSPYFEETYYFRTDPGNGFCIHRNWRDDEDFEEIFSAGDGETVTVTKGYHSSVGAPGSHMFFLNFLAGEPVAEQRSTPPCFHSDYTWIEDDWDLNGWELPIVSP